MNGPLYACPNDKNIEMQFEMNKIYKKLKKTPSQNLDKEVKQDEAQSNQLESEEIQQLKEQVSFLGDKMTQQFLQMS